MNNPDSKSSVCSKDSYGNVTAKNQGGNDVRNEMKYSGYTLDVGISVIAWRPDNTWLGKFGNLVAAKSAVDADIIKSK